ncbi:MAG: 50S ribosomal protein L11 methyltransferase [Chitinophagaceae bacterium]|nr:50S ribosomal protein L11 methyltransferase [Chitinophagaceae bacterium]
MVNYIQLHFASQLPDEQEILLAQLAEIGYEGFEQGTDYLNAYILESLFDESSLKDIISLDRHSITIEKIEPRNWNEEWEKSFEPVTIENFCAIRADFHPTVAGVEYEIIITPKMSFGTGHHATTFQVIQFMQQINFAGKDVMDFGTGTGVLAILAEKLNARHVYAIDYDEWSIENAKENIQVNHCSRIKLVNSDSLPENEDFDVILANINKHVIIQNLPAIAKHLRMNGVLILSGLLQVDEQDIAAAALNEDLIIQKHSEKNGWIMLSLIKGNSA